MRAGDGYSLHDIAAAVAAVYEECARIVEDLKIDSDAPLGPFHAAE
jgi:hypothetical protein